MFTESYPMDAHQQILFFSQDMRCKETVEYTKTSHSEYSRFCLQFHTFNESVSLKNGFTALQMFTFLYCTFRSTLSVVARFTHLHASTVLAAYRLFHCSGSLQETDHSSYVIILLWSTT